MHHKTPPSTPRSSQKWPASGSSKKTPRSSNNTTPRTSIAIKSLRVAIDHILTSNDNSMAKLNQLYQKGAFHDFSKTEDGQTHTVAFVVKMDSKTTIRSEKTRPSLKLAKKAAADDAVHKVVSFFRTRPARVKYAAPVPNRKSDEPTAKERLQMAADERSVKKLQEMKSAYQKGDTDVCVLSIDVEAFEFDHSKILEVGIAFSPIMDLANAASTQSTHIIVSDFLDISNGVQCPNNRENYNFGDSVHVDKSLLGFAVQIRITEHVRNYARVFLVGHSVANDLAWLQSIGINLVGSCDLCDIGSAYRGLKFPQHFVNMKSMEYILNDLSIDYSNLHNGGNDAYYNMQVLRGLFYLVEEEGFST